MNALGGLEVSGNFSVPNNAYITTLQVNQNSYLNGGVFLNSVDINSIYQKRPWIHASINADGVVETSKGLYTVNALKNPRSESVV